MEGIVAAWLAPHAPFEFREYPVADPQPDCILVRMRVCNICGSDLHLWHGDAANLSAGQVLGHEMVGTIEKLGKEVTADSLGRSLAEGDRILYSYSRHCGSCRYCLTREAPCPNRNKHWVGVSSDEPPHFHAGYGQFYYVRPGTVVLRVPDELPDDLVSPLNCAGAQVAEGLSRIEVRAGDTVVVQGAGGLGLYAVAAARQMGAEQIIVFDGQPQRLEFAKRFGADRVVDIGATTLQERQEQLLTWTRGFGADVVLEFAGVPSAVAEGVTLLRQGGRYLVGGNINLGVETSFDPTNIVRRCLTIKGIHGYEGGAIPAALDLLLRTRDRFPYGSLISHHFPFAEINEAFAVADSGQALRVSITF